mmetsp:Transcript_7731/g.31984  ORF Transcript_7731/g.31984 Transcript_7731/m.31984 type:complete len:582 (-) Transcript_7731:640-2385(-)
MHRGAREHQVSAREDLFVLRRLFLALVGDLVLDLLRLDGLGGLDRLDLLGRGLRRGLEVRAEEAVDDDEDGHARLDEREEDDDEGGDEAPEDGDEDPEREVVLGEDAGGRREDGPDDDDEDGEAPADLADPALGLVELDGVEVVLGEARLVVVEELDLAHRDPVVVLRVHLGVDVVDEARGADGDEVRREHDLVRAERPDRDAARLDGRGDEPRDEREDLARPRGEDGAAGRGVLPGHHVPERDDGRADDDAHEEVDPAEVEADVVEDDGEDAHGRAVEDDDVARDAHDVGARALGVEVGAVDVVRRDRRDRDRLGRARRDDGHEEHDGDHERALGAVDVRRDGGRHEARAGLAGVDGELERGGSEAARRREGEGDGEPDEAAEHVPLVRRGGLGRDGRLPVRLVDEDRAEVADDVDDAEHEPRAREHREVRAAPVARHRATRVPRRVVVVVRVGDLVARSGLVAVVDVDRAQGLVLAAARVGLVVAPVVLREDDLALLERVLHRLLEEVVDLVGRVLLDVHRVDHDEQDDEDDARMDVRREERRLEPAGRRVQDDAPRDEERRQVDVAPGERFHGCRTAK